MMSLSISLIIVLLCVYLLIIKKYREIIAINIISLSTIKVFIAEDIYSVILYCILAIMYGIVLYSLEDEYKKDKLLMLKTEYT